MAWSKMKIIIEWVRADRGHRRGEERNGDVGNTGERGLLSEEDGGNFKEGAPVCVFSQTQSWGETRSNLRWLF